MAALPLPKNLSPSAVSTIRQCPLRYKFAKIDKVPEPINESQALGSFVHDILARVYQLPPQERTLEKTRELAKSLWSNKWEAETKGVAKPSFRWQVWWCVENAFRLEDPTLLRPRGIEYWVRGKIEKVPMVGIIDRWAVTPENKLSVTDYKTGKMPLVSKYEQDKEFQLVVYGYMLKAETGLPVGHMELLYLKEGVRKPYEYGDKQVKDMLDVVGETWQMVTEMCERGEFPAQTSILCDWCAFKPICPAWNKK